eukprot:COSAG02_NODE_5891_length_3957_cov_2.013738_3_plen_71_part_00
MYKDGWVDYSMKCTLTIPEGLEEQDTLGPGTHTGTFRKDLTFILQTKTMKNKPINLLPLLGADSLLTSQR